MNDAPQSTDYLSYIGLGLLILCFGSTFYFNALTLEALSPMASGAARLIIAAVFLVPISIISGHGFPNSIILWKWAAVLGVTTLAVPFYLIVWAQKFIPSNVAALWFSSIPLLLLALSRLFLGTPISNRKWLGLLIGSMGLVLLASSGTSAKAGGGNHILPQLATLAACGMLASAAIIIRVMPKSSPIKINAGAILVAALVSLPVAVVEIPVETIPPRAAIGLLGVGIISTAIGQLLRVILIRRRGPIFLTPVGYLAAMVGAIMGITLLGEELTTGAVIAFVVILAGLIIAQDGTGRMSRL